MLTRNGAMKLIEKLWRSGGLTEDMEADVQKLKDDFDEREGMLRKFGEVYDGEDKDEYDYVPKEVHVEDNTEDGIDWKSKFEEMENRYVSRFFGRPTDAEDGEDFKSAMEGEEEDIKRDGEPQTWDELLATSEENLKDEKED